MTAISGFASHLETVADDLPYTLLADLVYDSARLSARIVVPAGFATDLASIPRLVQPLIPKEGKYNRPAVVHDFLYAVGEVNGRPITRADADAVLREAMQAVGVGASRVRMIYAGVRIGGWVPWGRYRKADHRG